jgi:uncharacterized membrane protein
MGTNPRRSHWKRALSVVIAVLVAVSVVAILGGFVFSTPEQFNTEAIVSAVVSNCSAANDSCRVILTNTGSSSIKVTGCGFSTGICTVTPLGTVKADSTLTVELQLAEGFEPDKGAQVIGDIQMSNGLAVPFMGVWS